MYYSTTTCLSMVERKNKVDNNDNSVSNITISSKDIKEKETKSKLQNNKLKSSSIQSDRDGLNDNSSI